MPTQKSGFPKKWKRFLGWIKGVKKNGGGNIYYSREKIFMKPIFNLTKFWPKKL